MIEFIQQYWEVIMVSGGAVVTSVISFVGVALKVKSALTPVKETVDSVVTQVKDVKESTLENVSFSNEYDNIKNEVLKIDLVAKLENPTLSDEVKAAYQTQLDKLTALNPLPIYENIKDKATDIIDNAKETL